MRWDWLSRAPYLLGGFASFLTYVLMLRIAGLEYVYHYVPSISNPVLFTPFVDVTLWAAITVVLSGTTFLTYWSRYGHWRAIALVVLTAGAISAAVLAVLYDVLPCLVLLSLVPLAYLTYKPLKRLDWSRCIEAIAYGAGGTWLLVELAAIFFQILSKMGIYLVDFEPQIMTLSVDLMYAYQNDSVQLFLLSGFSWIAIPLFLYIRKKIHFRRSSHISGSWYGYTILLTTLMVSCLAIGICQFRDSALYGVDAKYYFDRMTPTNDVATFLHLLSDDPRVAYLLMLKPLTFLGMPNELALKSGSLILIGLNACAFYFLGKEILGDHFGGGIVAAFSALGFQTTVSLYAAIYANWLAMFFAASAFAFYLRAIRSRKNLFLILACLLVAVSLLVHPWSGIPYLFILISACILDSISFMRTNRRLMVGILALASVLTLISMAGYIYSLSTTATRDLLNFTQDLQISNITKLSDNLEFTMDYMVGGFTSLPIFYTTALIGFFGLNLDKGLSSEVRLLILWFGATLGPLLFAEQWLQWRLIYLMPFQVMSGLGTYYICSPIIHSNRLRLLMLLFVSATIGTLFNYVLVSVAFIPSI
jgi:hypothetical protein